ncbi:MAG: DUF2232 domain-containing protein [Erysipelotrichia bacterium]|jgi:uncharacterized protein YybS (DUF2232 family)|nr:DUF2232 domain-containing protein [Erysipelotrichia bacterium]
MTTRSITQGALTIALSASLLLIARQFGTALDVFVAWLLPLPLVMYGARFKPSQLWVVFFSTLILSFLISPFPSNLYFMFYFLHGALFGIGLYLKWSRQQLFLSSMGSMLLVTLFSVGIFSSLFGYDLIGEYQTVLTQLTNMLTATGVTIPSGLDLGRITIISMIISYVIVVISEGWLVYLMAIILVKRLKIYELPTRSTQRFQLPKWAGVIALILLIPYPYLVVTQSETFLIPAISLYVSGVIVIVYNALNFVIILKRTLKIKYFYLFLILLLLLVPSIWLDAMLIVGLLDSFVNLRQRWLGA